MTTETPPRRSILARGWRGVVIGATIALGLPAAYRILAALVESGIAPYEQVHAMLNLLFTVSFAELVLAPLGIIIAGKAAGVRGPGPWILLFVVALPVVLVGWAIAVLTLTGALGNPF